MVGIPASIQNILNVTGQTILNNFASGYGPAAIAGIGIAYRLSNICFGLVMGTSQGVMPLVSYNYASGNIKRMRDAVNKTLKAGISALSVMAVFYFVFSEFFVSLFIDTEEVIQIGGVILKGFGLALPFIGADFIGVGVFQATGYGKMSLFFAIARKIILEIPFLIIFNKIWPLYGLGYAQLTAEIILAAISSFVLKHLFAKWENQAA